MTRQEKYPKVGSENGRHLHSFIRKTQCPKGWSSCAFSLIPIRRRHMRSSSRSLERSASSEATADPAADPSAVDPSDDATPTTSTSVPSPLSSEGDHTARDFASAAQSTEPDPGPEPPTPGPPRPARRLPTRRDRRRFHPREPTNDPPPSTPGRPRAPT